MREMIQTERDYVRSLEYIIEVRTRGVYTCTDRHWFIGNSRLMWRVVFTNILELYSRIVTRGHTPSVAW